VNRAIIRLYSLKPRELKEDVVVNILALVSESFNPASVSPAQIGRCGTPHLWRCTTTPTRFQSLVALPEPDFLTNLCLIPQEVVRTLTACAVCMSGVACLADPPPAQHDTERVKGLVEVESLLQTGKFGEFWERSRQADVAEVLGKVSGFADQVRKFMITALLITYASIKATALRRSLDLDDVAPLAAARGWTVEGTGEDALVTFPANSENQPKAETVKDAATFTDVSHLMQLLSK
jgi:hypothetical protein